MCSSRHTCCLQPVAAQCPMHFSVPSSSWANYSMQHSTTAVRIDGSPLQSSKVSAESCCRLYLYSYCGYKNAIFPPSSWSVRQRACREKISHAHGGGSFSSILQDAYYTTPSLMAVSLPGRDTLPGIGVVRREEQPRPQAACLSSGRGSERNNVLPLALALDGAAVGSQGSSPPQNSGHKVELRRKSTSSDTPVRNPEHSANAGTKKVDLDAESVVARSPSRPASSRPTAAGVKPKERVSIARKVTRLLGLGREARSASCDAGVSWKPHEKLLKALGYRPRGHGRPFTEKYTLGDTLGTGGFGVVRDGERSPEHLQCID